MTKARIDGYRNAFATRSLDDILTRSAVLSAMYLCCPGRGYSRDETERGEDNAVNLWRAGTASKPSTGIVFG